MTSQHSMDFNFEDEPQSFQPGSPANPTALRENVLRLVMSVISGERSCEYWAKCNHAGSWEKTSQDSLVLSVEPSSDGYSMTWPNWGTALAGVATEHRTLEPFTGGSGFLLLLTARASHGMAVPLSIAPGGAHGMLEQVIARERLPTPRTCSAMAAGLNPNPNHFPNLETVIAREMLPTPNVVDAGGLRKGMRPSRAATNRKTGYLCETMLPTPAASQAHKPVRPLAPSEADGTHGTMLVAAFTDQLPEGTGERGHLNPSFVSWMMNFPADWFDIE